ncbi:MAG TPA: redoxin domain-containing protein [Bacteroidota bacterium]|nr:redoxin domain-containing protein [Bacteroidota bacterium]
MRSFIVFVTAIAFSCALVAQSQDTLRVGQQAPDFTLPYATKDSIYRQPIRLSDIVGKKNIILAFYPADWSGGCTKEVCTLRDDFGNLEKLDAEILAISGDYVYSHHEWAMHHNLPFKLVSDHLHVVAQKYFSYNEKAGMNRRTVFVVDRKGLIAFENLHYSVADNEDFNSLKEALAKLR